VSLDPGEVLVSLDPGEVLAESQVPMRFLVNIGSGSPSEVLVRSW